MNSPLEPSPSNLYIHVFFDTLEGKENGSHWIGELKKSLSKYWKDVMQMDIRIRLWNVWVVEDGSKRQAEWATRLETCGPCSADHHHALGHIWLASYIDSEFFAVLHQSFNVLHDLMVYSTCNFLFSCKLMPVSFCGNSTENSLPFCFPNNHWY